MTALTLTSTWLRRCAAASLSLALLSGEPADASPQPSDASALSMLPVAVVSAAPAALFTAGASLVLVGVEISAAGTTWVLERASDGVRATLRVAGKSALAVGTTVAVSVMASGWVLSAGGQAIACIPDASAAALLYNERVTR